MRPSQKQITPEQLVFAQEHALVRIVDDEADLREALSFVLDMEGWKTVTYGRAEDFFTGDSPSEPGCVVLDVRMPGMSGIEAQHEMRSRGIALPIIFLTGHGDVDMAVGAVQDGAFDFLLKPVDNERFLNSVACAAWVSAAAAEKTRSSGSPHSPNASVRSLSSLRSASRTAKRLNEAALRSVRWKCTEQTFCVSSASKRPKIFGGCSRWLPTKKRSSPLIFELGKEHVGIAEVRPVLDAHRIDDAFQVVKLMLHHSGMKTLGFSLDGLAVKSKAGVVNSPGTRDDPAHAGYGEAPLPAVLPIISGAFEQQFDGRVDEHGLRHCRRIRVAARGFQAKTNDAFAHAHLRRGNADAALGMHGVPHIRNELSESGAPEIPNRQRLLHQHGFPKTHDFQNHIGSSSNEIWC